MMQKYVTHRENLGLLPSGFPPNEAQRVIYLAADVDAREAQHIAIDRAQKAKIERLEKALQSIADSTCCEGCQEAKLVAQHALSSLMERKT